MINYNIMDLIMNKKIFKEWEEKMIKVNEEYRELFKLNEITHILSIIYCKNCIAKGIDVEHYQLMYNYYRTDICIYRTIYIYCTLCKLISRPWYERIGKLSKNY